MASHICIEYIVRALIICLVVKLALHAPLVTLTSGCFTKTVYALIYFIKVKLLDSGNSNCVVYTFSLKYKCILFFIFSIC